jgi:hypothetical protein
MQKESVYDRMTNAEKEVAKTLKEYRIHWSYEQPVFIWDENKRPRVWTPDFYLTHFGVYIEVCGSKTFEYNYRRRIYERNGYRVIFLHVYKETLRWRNHLFRYLRVITRYRYNRLFSLLKGG